MPYRSNDLIIEEFAPAKKVGPRTCNLCLRKDTAYMAPALGKSGEILPFHLWMVIFLCQDCFDAWAKSRMGFEEKVALANQNHHRVRFNKGWQLSDYENFIGKPSEKNDALSFFQRIKNFFV